MNCKTVTPDYGCMDYSKLNSVGAMANCYSPTSSIALISLSEAFNVWTANTQMIGSIKNCSIYFVKSTHYFKNTCRSNDSKSSFPLHSQFKSGIWKLKLITRREKLSSTSFRNFIREKLSTQEDLLKLSFLFGKLLGKFNDV